MYSMSQFFCSMCTLRCFRLSNTISSGNSCTIEHI